MRAAQLGLRVVHADVLDGNAAMLHLLREAFTGIDARRDGDRWALRCPVPSLAFEPSDLLPTVPVAA